MFDLRQTQNDSFTIWREYYVLTPTFSPTLTICKGHLLTSIIRLFLQFQWQVNQSTSIKYARQPLVTVNMPMGHVLLDTSTCGVSFVTVKVPEFILVDIYIGTWSYEPIMWFITLITGQFLVDNHSKKILVDKKSRIIPSTCIVA